MPRVGLTPERVVAYAGEIADEVGLEQLTLAAVAQRAGVALPSLYKHVRGLGELRRLIATQALRELGGAIGKAAVGRSKTDALRAVAEAYWRYAHEHPGRYAATLAAPDPADPELAAAAGDLLATVYAVLRSYGIKGDDAVDATRTLRALLHGYVALEAAGGFGMPRSVRQSFDRAVVALDGVLAAWS